MTKEMFQEITAWQRLTFPQSTGLSAAHHLHEEVKELIDSLSTEKGKEIRNEFADCFLLIFCSADRYGLSYEEICEAINDKMEVNKSRNWGSPNDKGYVKHVEK